MIKRGSRVIRWSRTACADGWEPWLPDSVWRWPRTMMARQRVEMAENRDRPTACGAGWETKGSMSLGFIVKSYWTAPTKHVVTTWPHHSTLSHQLSRNGSLRLHRFVCVCVYKSVPSIKIHKGLIFFNLEINWWKKLLATQTWRRGSTSLNSVLRVENFAAVVLSLPNTDHSAPRCAYLHVGGLTR